ncbi:MAG: C45 family peptidase [Candidatus Thorarchaeota archaeon]
MFIEKWRQEIITPEIVNLQGNHYEIGVQHGQQLAGVILDTVVPFVQNDMNELGISPNQAENIASDYEDLIGRRFPQILEETRGIAEGAGIKYETALAVLFFWEIRDTVSHSFPECSSFVAAGEATDGNYVIASQNSDWPQKMRNKNIGHTFRVEAKGKYRFIGRGLAGNLGRPSVIGFNEEGLTFVGSGIRQLEGAGFGFPPLTITRIGLEECATVEEFLNLVNSIPRWSHAGENVDVVDRDGNMARISFSTNRTLFVQTKDHFLGSTNHYHNLEMRHFGPSNRDQYPSSFARYERLVELLKGNYGDIDPEKAIDIMSDHKHGDKPPDGVKSICRHGTDTRTMTNVVLSPSTGEFWISKGNPCERNYSKFSL